MKTLLASGILVSTTIGAGIFALPAVAARAGWGVGLAYLLVLSVAVAFVHTLIYRVFEKEGEDIRLLSHVREALGRVGTFSSDTVTIGGLVLALLIYLILSRSFLGVLLGEGVWVSGALVVFWSSATLLAFLRSAWFSRVEFVGALALGAVVVFILIRGWAGLPDSPSLSWRAGDVPFAGRGDIGDAFLPFGPILFSLAGWTAIAPMYSHLSSARKSGRSAILLGTALIATLYVFFVVGVFGIYDGTPIPPDTLSGLAQIAPGLATLLAGFGIVAIWTSYVPIARTLVRFFHKDLSASSGLSKAIVALVPPLLLLLGFDDLLDIIGVAGGIFLALQYFFLVLVSVRTLGLAGWSRRAAFASGALFLLAAAYEVAIFVL